MIASDIHGDAGYCEQLLQDFTREKDRLRKDGHSLRLLLLGDLLYHGPRNDLPSRYAPKEVAALLNAYKQDILCVRGNCEAEVDQMMLDFPVLADYALLSVGNRLLFATHGHHFNRETPPPLQPGDLLLYGHTHVPMVEKDEKTGILCLNPGSVSIPKRGSERGYLLLDPEREEVTHYALGGKLLGQYPLRNL